MKMYPRRPTELTFAPSQNCSLTAVTFRIGREASSFPDRCQFANGPAEVLPDSDKRRSHGAQRRSKCPAQLPQFQLFEQARKRQTIVVGMSVHWRQPALPKISS